MKRKMLLTASAVVFLALVSGFMKPADTDYFLKINKSIDVFGRVYREVATSYVDEVDPEKFMQAGITGMLGALDPYTVFIDRDESDEVDLLTNGRYGGIGVSIGFRDGTVKVISVMDGYSAQRQGVLPGDVFLEINGVPVRGKNAEDIRSLTRGEPGTDVKVLIEREGEAKPLEFVLIREEIQIRNLTYVTMLDGGIAYLRLERFSRKAGDEVRQAIKELKLTKEIRGVVLDLRGNPGGLLDAAVEVVSKFVPSGSMVVSTKGRRAEADKKYLSTEEPLLPTTPLIVLTDRGSASASEIVAGSLQDMDRALIVGTRTFGKGLVQTIVPLSHGAQLKITTARYYIPSGRSIQEIDYLHRDRNGVFTVTPDSLRREFRTASGRKVYELGGVTPDSLVNLPDEGSMVRELHRKSLFFKFVNRYVAAHKGETITGVNDQMLGEFRAFLEKEKFEFQEESEKKVEELLQIADRSHFSKEVREDLEILQKALTKEKARGFDRYLEPIKADLDVELMARVGGEQGRIKASLKYDDQLKVASALLRDTQAMMKHLKP